MRINRYLALASGMSRRHADQVINQDRVKLNGVKARLGDKVNPGDEVQLDNKIVELAGGTKTIMLNKPAGYVCSRRGQGSKTIYDLLPPEFHSLKPVGRLDKDSSGLLLLTNEGNLAHQLTHPSFQKQKVYEVELSKPLGTGDKNKIERGIELEDGLSQLKLDGSTNKWIVKMSEGRNRQIRRTFEALGYKVTKLHRTKFGGNTLPINLKKGAFKMLYSSHE